MILKRRQIISLIFLIVIFGIAPVVWYYLGGESSPAPAVFPFRKSPWFEQLALAGAIGFIKPLYTLLALFAIIVLRRPKSQADFALFWGLIFFCVAELACGANIIFYGNRSYSLEFVHGYGMVLNFAFVAYALIQTVDVRVLGYSDPAQRCALSALCAGCRKAAIRPCILRRMVYFFLPILIILAIIPLISGFNFTSYQTQILSWTYIFSRPEVFQIFDFRIVPLYALLFLITAYVVFLRNKDNLADLFKVFLAAGIGSLGFSYLRLVFFDAYAGNLIWAEFWEELTELIYISALIFLMWLFAADRLQGKFSGVRTKN